MELKVYGCRGSYPEPGEDTVRYGGRTSCYALQTEAGLIILDAGNGLVPLGRDLIRKFGFKGGIEAKVFISHVHGDHIEGWPFFTPAYLKGNKFSIYGLGNVPDKLTEESGRQVKDPETRTLLLRRRKNRMDLAMATSTQAGRHPITFAMQKVIGADIETVDLDLPGSEIQGNVDGLEGVAVEYMWGNHPDGALVYKITSGDKSLLFTGDYEQGPLLKTSKHPLTFNRLWEFDSFLINFISGVDVALMDSQYTPADYERKKTWGHPTAERSLEIAAEAARRAGKKIHVILTHHEPEYTDAFLDKRHWDLEQFVAKENLFHHITWELARDGMVREIKA